MPPGRDDIEYARHLILAIGGGALLLLYILAHILSVPLLADSPICKGIEPCLPVQTTIPVDIDAFATHPLVIGLSILGFNGWLNKRTIK